MKRLLFLTISLLLTLNQFSNAQGLYQFADPGFENFNSGNEPGYGWNSFASATGSLSGFKGQSPSPSSVTPGANGTQKAVQIYSKKVFIANANGNLTTGIINMGSTSPADASNYNFTKRDDANHSLRFAGRPDAVSFYAKFKSGGSPNGRATFILHGNCDYRDPETETQKNERIGKVYVDILPSEDWVKYEKNFDYEQNQPDIQYLLASITTNPQPGGSQNDFLQIDEIYFTYYHSLSALSYKNATLNFDENTQEYDLSSYAYHANDLQYTVKGAGASVEEKYDTTTGILTLTVKGNDFDVNPESCTQYQIQFNKDSEPVIPVLGERVTSLMQISQEKTYVLYNEAFTTYAVHNPNYSKDQLWAAEMTGDASHPLKSSTYSEKLDLTAPGSSWMLVYQNEGYYLYNVGAERFLATPKTGDGNSCYFSETPVKLSLTDHGKGVFSFTATDDEYDFLCATPQLEAPICNWTADDAGSQWYFIENPSVAAIPGLSDIIGDGSGTGTALGQPVQQLNEISTEKAYVLYNEHFTTYAIAENDYPEFVWTAGMTGDEGHPVHSETYSRPFDQDNPNHSWMIVPYDGKFYLYNLGAKKFLHTPGYEDKTLPCRFRNGATPLTVEDLGGGHFAITASGQELDYLCVAPQSASTPLSTWKKTDSGAAWQIRHNPLVETDPAVLDLIYPAGISATENINRPVDVFTPAGVCIRKQVKASQALQGLPKGIYIINGKKTIY